MSPCPGTKSQIDSQSKRGDAKSKLNLKTKKPTNTERVYILQAYRMIPIKRFYGFFYMRAMLVMNKRVLFIKFIL
jgi:hypothetical protein